MIVVDTHAWLWATIAPDRLSSAASTAIEQASEILVSAISCLEIAALVRKKRIALDRDPTTWIRQALAASRVASVSVDSEIAAHAGALAPPFPGDPADRLIYATAIARGVPLVTRDNAIREFDAMRTIW